MSGRSPRWFNGFDRLWEPNFADNSWKQVIWCCQNRFIPHTWAVGDQLIMTIDGDDYPIDIIGMNHDNYIDSSGKAPLTFQLHPCYDHAYKIFTTVPTSASWKDSDMRQINLPAIMALMPEEVQTAIRVVEKNTPSSGLTNDKLFALSKAEFTGDTTSSYGTQYAYYAAGNTPAKTRRTSTTKRSHWTRDTDPDNAVNFLYIDTTGAIASNKVTTSNMYVAFAFCFQEGV